MRVQKALRSWRHALLIGSLALAASAVLGAGAGGFLGKVALEWDDGDAFNRNRVILLADFGFEDSTGRQWLAKRGAVLDGRSFAPLFERLIGLPFHGEHRRAAILHDYFSQQLDQEWKEVRRMYYEALIAEGMDERQAKTDYAVAMATSERWEQVDSGCYNHCHTTATPLRWKPDITQAELQPVLDLVDKARPSVDDIDAAIAKAVPKPGPHLFAQLRPEENAAIRRGREAEGAGVADGLVVTKSSLSVKATTDKLEDLAKQRGLTVFARIDHAVGAAKVGKVLRPTELLIFGSPQAGTPFMECSQTVAIDLPLKALIWEDAASQVWVGYNDPAYLAERHAAEACSVIENMQKALSSLIEATVTK